VSTDPKNIRLMLGAIREALEGHSREQLAEILGYVFKEYVVEGATPLGSAAGAVLDAKTELEGLRFPQLITWLQHHLDVPELALFEVDGDRVSLRIAGRSIPIDPSATAAPPPLPAPAPRAAPQVTIQSAPVRAPSQPPPAPTPSSASTPGPAPAPAPQPAQPAAKPEEPSEQKDTRFSRLEVD
jgi:hypothetical protein